MVGTTRTAGCLLFPRGSLLWEDFYNERRFEDWREWGRGGGRGRKGRCWTTWRSWNWKSPNNGDLCWLTALWQEDISVSSVVRRWEWPRQSHHWCGSLSSMMELPYPSSSAAACSSCCCSSSFFLQANKVVIIHEVSDSRGWEWAVVVLSFPPVKVVIESRVCVASLISEWWLMYSYSRRSLNSYFHCTATLCTLSSPGLRYQLQSQQNIAIAYFKAGICKIYQRFPFFCSFYNSFFW